MEFSMKLYLVATFMIITTASTSMTTYRSDTNYIEESERLCDAMYKDIGGDFLICFLSGDFIEISGDMTRDGDCFRTKSSMFVYKCGGKLEIRNKPKAHGCYFESNTICKSLNIVSKILYMVLIHMFLRLLKDPIMILFHYMTNMFPKRKRCENCKVNYVVSHCECKTSNHHRSTENYMLYYVILVLMTFFTYAISSQIDERKVTYEYQNGLTKFRIDDVENMVQVYKQSNNYITFKVISSVLELELEKSHDVMSVKNNKIVNTTTYCDEGEYKCPETYGNFDGYFKVKKVRDGFNCIFSQTIICGLCGVELETLGEVYRVKSIEPIVSIEVTIGEFKEVVRIEKNSKLEFNRSLYLEKIVYNNKMYKSIFKINDEFYTGNICNTPDDECFGDIISKNNEMFMRYDPIVYDDKVTSLSIAIKRCVKNNDFSYKNLDKLDINQFKIDGIKYIMDYQFGYLNVMVDGKYMMEELKCKKTKEVDEITVNGCYDCYTGYDVSVVAKNEDCGVLICSVNGVEDKVIMNKMMTLHHYSVSETITISCNSYTKTFKLGKNEDYKNYRINRDSAHTVEGVHKDIFDVFKFSFPNFKIKIIIACVIVIIATYFIVEFKSLVSRSHKLIKGRKDGYNMVVIPAW